MYLLFAFLGGLILNLMPCVFPVLSIKLISLFEKSRLSGKSSRISAWFYTFGILTSFWALALSIVFLRSLGLRLGWGFQLQSPVFLSLLAGLFVLLSFNFLGFFEIGTRLMSVGGAKTTGDFLAGVLAVIVATPCTAPFMGTAMGFAFSQGPTEIAMIFGGLGVGLAFPFLVIAHVPFLQRLLPKPGAWMDVFKKALSLPLLLTTVWLLWILKQQIQWQGVAWVLVGMIAISAGAVLPKPRVRLLLWTLGFLHLGFSSAWMSERKSESFSESTPSNSLWQNYSKKDLALAQKANRPVFVDFTAAWCLTCQVNEATVLSRPEILSEFKNKNVLLMKADWTERNPEITLALEALERNGVPVYALYLPGKTKPLLLSEVLTSESVLKVLRDLP
jgi:thiol:disulfide interchange protein DsbD